MRPGPATRLILKSGFSLGDAVMLTAVVRDIHRLHPGRFLTEVRTKFPELWEHNPRVTTFGSPLGTVCVDCFPSLIRDSNSGPWHYLQALPQLLSKKLGVPLYPTEFKGELHLSNLEKSWMSQVRELTGRDIPFWIVVTGGKFDITIKWWETARYQSVVDHFRGRIQFVQVGETTNHHPRLRGVIDLRGKTSVRQLIRLIYHSQGVLCPVTSLMHLAAATPARDGGLRPCVVIAGGREPAHWEAYPGHQFIQNVGSLACCALGGCWKERTQPLGDGDKRDLQKNLCVDVVQGQPRCMHLIQPSTVIDRIENYFAGGRCREMSAPHRGAACRAVRATRLNPFDQNSVTVLNAPAAAAAFLQRMPAYPAWHSGRGIVIGAGGALYFTNAYLCARMLRWHGCKLPIQFWHLGPEEMDETMIGLAREIGVECVDGERIAVQRKLNPLGGWELKAAAILYCSFEEVLLLDADNVPLRDPEFLFDTSEFRRDGAIFWPDHRVLDATRPIWKFCGLTPRSEREFESGQILVDKKRCWEALQLALWYNNHSDFFYRHVHGDKETFHLAFRRVQKKFTLIPTPIHRLRGTMCQHDLDGNRLFQHRNLLKWRLFGPNRKVRGFRLESRCRRFLEELESRWDGFIRHAEAVNHEFLLRPNSNDSSAFSLVTERNLFELPERFDSRDAILDLSAHIGAFAYACLSRGCRDVVAWEADPEYYALARRNLARFGNRVHLRWGKICERNPGDLGDAGTVRSRGWVDPASGSSSPPGAGNAESGLIPRELPLGAILSRRKHWKWAKINLDGLEWPRFLAPGLMGRIENLCGEIHLLDGINSDSRVNAVFKPSETALRMWLGTYYETAKVSLPNGTGPGFYWGSRPRRTPLLRMGLAGPSSGG